MGFVIYESSEDVEKFRNNTAAIADHFGSELMAEQYLNGLIDWDGRPIGDEDEYPY